MSEQAVSIGSGGDSGAQQLEAAGVGLDSGSGSGGGDASGQALASGDLALPDGVPDGVPDGLRRLATLRPRYVSRATTSVGVSPPPLPPPPPPPPPPAASHSSTDSRSPPVTRLLGTSWLTLTYRKQPPLPNWRALSALNA